MLKEVDTTPTGPPQLVKPNDPAEIRSEFDKARLAPINPLKRKRRSRRVRKVDIKQDKLRPLVPGASTDPQEQILRAYVGEQLDKKQEAGEDYWIDPESLAQQLSNKRNAESRRKRQLRRTDAYKEDKLKQEIAAPYKNNLIGYAVVLVGFAAVVFSVFPNLLDTPVSIEPKFPDQL